jgi:uncharacterized protein (TIGR03083 family)
VSDVLTALQSSVDRFASILGGLSDEQVAEPSYDDDWNIGAVASHLGSGAQIFGMFIRAGDSGGEAPGPEQFSPIWEAWNAKSAPQQAHDAVIADADFMTQLEGMSEAAQAAWRLDMFGTEQDLESVLLMRLAEHSVHTWDVAVALDPTATVADDAVPLVLDRLAAVVERVAKQTPSPLAVEVRTTDPGRRMVLTLGDRSSLAQADDTATDATLTLPAEALIRLVYGRLDPDHTPASVTAEGVDLDLLRRVFPGF